MTKAGKPSFLAFALCQCLLLAWSIFTPVILGLLGSGGQHCPLAA